MTTYKEFHARSIADRDTFWAEQARLIDWHTPPAATLDYSRPPFAKWFVGGTTNLCHNAIDRHLAARGDQAALIYISTETGEEKTYTFSQLYREVNRFAGILKGQGVGRGDRVLIYMPMIPEATFAMLACARIGAIHSVVFGGFASVSLATRIDDAQPKLIVSADAGIARRQAGALQASARRGDQARPASAAEGGDVNRGMAEMPLRTAAATSTTASCAAST
jgi:propionyl-CoA synthetase